MKIKYLIKQLRKHSLEHVRLLSSSFGGEATYQREAVASSVNPKKPGILPSGDIDRPLEVIDSLPPIDIPMADQGTAELAEIIFKNNFQDVSIC